MNQKAASDREWEITIDSNWIMTVAMAATVLVISRNTTAKTGKTPAAAGTIFVAIAASCVGNTMRRGPTTSESHPITVTSTGQPPVHLLWK